MVRERRVRTNSNIFFPKEGIYFPKEGLGGEKESVSSGVFVVVVF
ncbi:hypothetical protein CLW00_11738 [Mongoliibacter ruber]|uniref:Uncharacterized protein n=1 Tax=Mongoliibacter ruber TaxID=1750599 RepID=A0A2T0WDI9_9BACT|nr:hypothetical protein CLW00_11738 [Mongoliibacter ruber]